MPKITQWSCDGCDISLGSGDTKPKDSHCITAEVRAGTSRYKFLNLVLCKSCHDVFFGQIDPRSWPRPVSELVV